MKTTYYTMRDLPAVVGATYYQVRWATVNGVVKPRIVGKRTRLFTEAQAEQLRQHFAKPANTEATKS
jgi:hypothetical protein